MRTFAWFFGLLVLGFAGMAFLTYPAWLLVHPTLDFPFHRIGTRIAELTLAFGFVAVARHLGLANRESLGYGTPRPIFIREMLLAVVIGVVIMLPIIAVIIGFDLRDLKDDMTLNAQTFAKLTIIGLLRGFAVAFIEETFLRGAMFTGMSREVGPKLTIFLTSLIYATTHFIGRIKIPADQVTITSGFDLLAGTFNAFQHPLGIADAFLCLFGVGVLLGMVRMLTGSIAACIGLHAGWVFVITFVRETSTPDYSRPLSFLVSRFDGFVGWLVLAWICVFGVWLFRFYTKRPLIPRTA
jgi:membrane protease YdiL (CAAX protease family)